MTSPSLLPVFTLLERTKGLPGTALASSTTESSSRSVRECWDAEVKNLKSSEQKSLFKSIQGDLAHLEGLSFDCLVSPANSFGIMDGGYDMALSQIVQLDNDIYTLTNIAQSAIMSRYRGYAPPGSCTLVPIPPRLGTHAPPSVLNPLSAKVLAIVPTMRTPEDVSWSKDLVYNCAWSMFVEISKWNEEHPTKEEGRIESVLMTGLATGSGKISPARFARQWFLAFKHFTRPSMVQPRWENVAGVAKEIEDSWYL